MNGRCTVVLVADPLPSVLPGVGNLVEASGFDFVEPRDFDEVTGAAADLRPDLDLADMGLPPCDCLMAVGFRRDPCGARTIVWSRKPATDGALGPLRGAA